MNTAVKMTRDGFLEGGGGRYLSFDYIMLLS